MICEAHQIRIGGGAQEIYVDTVSLKSLVGNTKVDFLKVDIEGGEHLLFNSLYASDFLNNVNQAIVEYHHNYSSQTNAMSDFIGCFERNRFNFQIVSVSSAKERGDRYFQDILYKFNKTSPLILKN